MIKDRRVIGIVTIVCAAVTTVGIFAGVHRKPFEPSARSVVAEFERVGQLHPGDHVRLEGNIDGKVTRVEPAPTPERARVTLAVNDDAGPIYGDARARVRATTLLGGVFYVDVERGTPGAGPLGDRVIPVTRTSVQTELEDITDVFRENAVRGVRTLPRQLAIALADPQPPVDALRTADAVAPGAAAAIYALRGRRPGRDLPRLVHGTARAVAALDTPTDDLRTAVAGAAATLQTTGRRAAELRRTLAAGPAVTDDMIHTFARLDRTLDIARGLVHRLRPSVAQVAPTIRQLRPTLTLADQALRVNTPLLKPLGATLRAGGLVGSQLGPLLDGAVPSLRRLDRTILPYLGRKDPIDGYSTTVMIGGFFAGFGGVTTFQDQNGHLVRFPASAGGPNSPSAYVPCSSSLIDPDAASQLACDSLNTALGTYLSYLPAPPTVSKRSPR